jgi:hypothetical protein
MTNPGDEIIWQSTITRAMVADWSLDEIDLLITDLDDAVEATCQDYELGN